MVLPGINEVRESLVVALLHPVCITFGWAHGCINNASLTTVTVMLSRLFTDAARRHKKGRCECRCSHPRSHLPVCYMFMQSARHPSEPDNWRFFFKFWSWDTKWFPTNTYIFHFSTSLGILGVQNKPCGLPIPAWVESVLQVQSHTIGWCV